MRPCARLTLPAAVAAMALLAPPASAAPIASPATVVALDLRSSCARRD
jgi:hypothetical protein